MNYKIIAYCFLLFVIPMGCSSQSPDETPLAVQKAFEKKYPGENDPDWHIDKNGNYEANFKKEGIKYKADYTPSGNWIETETRINEKDLPDVVKKALKENFDDLKVVEIELVDHNSKGTFYDIELKKDGEKFDVEYNSLGQKIN